MSLLDMLPDEIIKEFVKEAIDGLELDDLPALEESENAVNSFAALADTLDKRGFYRAADKIDQFLKIRASKKNSPDRRLAAHIRKQLKSEG